MSGHLNYVCPEKMRALASQMTEILSLTRLFITCDHVIGLRLDPHYLWPQKIEFSNFSDGILEQVGTVCHLQSNNSQI